MSLNDLSIASFVSLITLPFSLLYLYSLFNLYIGRNVKKYRIVIIALNFVFLIGYLILLITIPEYNQVPLIILLMVLLSVIVLGIIGGFLFNEDYSLDNSKHYIKQIMWFSRVIKIIFIFIGVIIGSRVIYEIMTHKIQRVSNLTYVLENSESDSFCDAHLEFGIYNDATLFMHCDNMTYIDKSISNVKIILGDEIIAESDSEITNIEEVLFYDFKYDFETIFSDHSDVNEVRIEITIDGVEYDYIFNIYNYIIDYEDEVVFIWISE